MKVDIDKSGRITIFDFSSVQAYKIAVRMEQDGVEFYRAFAKKIKDKDLRRDIDFVIKEEEAHLELFEGLLAKEKEISGDDFEEDDIVSSINSLVFQESFQSGTPLYEAMNKEKRSIIFYTSCLARSKDPKVKKIFSSIIGEEQKHQEKFAGMLRDKCIKTKKECLL